MARVFCISFVDPGVEINRGERIFSDAVKVSVREERASSQRFLGVFQVVDDYVHKFLWQSECQRPGHFRDNVVADRRGAKLSERL